MKEFGEILKAELAKAPDDGKTCPFAIAAHQATPKVQQLLKELVDSGELVFIPRFDVGVLPHTHEKPRATNDVFIFRVETDEMFEALGLSESKSIFIENHSQYMN